MMSGIRGCRGLPREGPLRVECEQRAVRMQARCDRGCRFRVDARARSGVVAAPAESPRPARAPHPRISPVTLPASTAVPTTRGVMSSMRSRPVMEGVICRDVGARVGRGGGIHEGYRGDREEYCGGLGDSLEPSGKSIPEPIPRVGSPAVRGGGSTAREVCHLGCSTRRSRERKPFRASPQ